MSSVSLPAIARACHAEREARFNAKLAPFRKLSQQQQNDALRQLIGMVAEQAANGEGEVAKWASWALEAMRE